MKHRNPFVVVLLSLVTLGIYDIYWLVKTKKVLNEKTSQHVPTIWLFFAPIVAVIAGAIVLAASGVKAAHNTNLYTSYYASQTIKATTSTNNALAIPGIILLVLGGLGVLFLGLYWLFKYSKAVDEYTSGKMSTAVSFLVLWLVHFIGVALIQDAFNDVNSKASAGTINMSSPPLPPQPPTAKA